MFLFYMGENIYNKFSLPLHYKLYFTIVVIMAAIALFQFPKKLLLPFKICAPAILFMVVLRFITVGFNAIPTMIEHFSSGFIICALFYAIYMKNDKKTNMMIPRLLLLIFCINCFVAIVERLTGSYIFGWFPEEGVQKEGWGEGAMFRSCGIWANPLQNALMISTMMTFILFSEMKFAWKWSLWLLGMLSIACFNTRSSMAGNLMIMVLYVMYSFFKGEKGMSRWVFVLFILVVGYIGSYYFFNTELGGRLAEVGLDDSSTQVRLDAWYIFDIFSLRDFLFGRNYAEATNLIDNLGLFATENFWFDWMIQYGIICIIIFMFAVYKVAKQLYIDSPQINKIASVATFWLLASVNNSLSSSSLPLIWYFICIMVFSPQNSNYLPYNKKI